jgi:enamine deaminase RidA (YjgF/YER057c/UK114 family)
MPVDVRTVQSQGSTEVFITATAPAGLPAQQQAGELFVAIGNVLRATDAQLLEERIFATDQAMTVFGPLRADAYGGLDDGVPPSRLAVPQGIAGDLAGVQVHAIRSSRRPEPLRFGEWACGRILRGAGAGYLSLSGVCAPEVGPDPAAQARAVFERMESQLRQVGADMHSVARTWLWLDDILSWYGDFNRVRNAFFTERGLLDGRATTKGPPASTGIGIRLAGGARCGLDLIAILGKRDSTTHYSAAGCQGSPYKYGSAFSRASVAATPAGRTVYVAGTAAIDAQGKTQHVGDGQAQIERTIENVRAVLKDLHCTDQDVVQALAYSKTVEIERLFLDRQKDLPWPCLSTIADICREELLFELEVTACPGAKTPSL